MVPIKLKLSNFTSYGQSPLELDFTKFHLAAISGLNGAGKSSLLDAITWCIWGTSRAGESSDGLIRLGQESMFVELSFDLDGHTYTVKRSRTKKSGGNTSLELWSNSHNLTEGTIKATQQKIINLLHLTFETFTNSSFLRQGHADEFTTKGPTDRKRILADILGLDHYDKLEEKAKEKVRDIQNKLSLLEYQLLEIESELSQKAEREKNLSQTKQEGDLTKLKLQKIETEIQEIEEQQNFIKNKLNSLEEQRQRYLSISKELNDLKSQIDLKQAALKNFKQILDQKSEIEENNQKLENLNEQKDKLDSKRSQLIKIKDELSSLQKVILERENKRSLAITKIEVEISTIQTEIDQLNSQNEHLSKHKNTCPTCNQIIDDEKNSQITKRNQNDIKTSKEKITILKSTLEKYKAVVLPEYQTQTQMEESIKALGDETKNYLELQSQINSLNVYQDLFIKLQQAEAAVKTHTELIEELKKMYLTKDSELQKLSNFENDLEEYLKSLKDIEQKFKLQSELKKELSDKLLELRTKYGEATSLVSRTKQMETLQEDKKEEKTKLSAEKQIYEELSLAFSKKGIQAMIIEQAIPEIEDETNHLLEKLTEGRMRIRIDSQKETKTKVQTSEGKVHATVETLDIIISDEMGERPLDLFSGGENFRVNIALRIAISKLLAHRAGAKLQFLVIDEGFGTQDASGRTRLIEIIDTIKNDFAKILIITHLEELKEEFPTWIEVTKSSSGSTFKLIGDLNSL